MNSYVLVALLGRQTGSWLPLESVWTSAQEGQPQLLVWQVVWQGPVDSRQSRLAVWLQVLAVLRYLPWRQVRHWESVQAMQKGSRVAQEKGEQRPLLCVQPCWQAVHASAAVQMRQLVGQARQAEPEGARQQPRAHVAQVTKSAQELQLARQPAQMVERRKQVSWQLWMTAMVQVATPVPQAAQVPLLVRYNPLLQVVQTSAVVQTAQPNEHLRQVLSARKYSCTHSRQYWASKQVAQLYSQGRHPPEAASAYSQLGLQSARAAAARRAPRTTRKARIIIFKLYYHLLNIPIIQAPPTCSTPTRLTLLPFATASRSSSMGRAALPSPPLLEA